MRKQLRSDNDRGRGKVNLKNERKSKREERGR
jgi:hypothetical protein